MNRKTWKVKQNFLQLICPVHILHICELINQVPVLGFQRVPVGHSFLLLPLCHSLEICHPVCNQKQKAIMFLGTLFLGNTYITVIL